MSELRIERGTEPGRVYPLYGEDVFLGRSRSCRVTIAEQDISRKHARVFFKDERYWVEDLGSRNGTAVNGKKIEGAALLSPGDHVRVGRTWLSFAADAASDPTKLLQSDYLIEERCNAPYLLYKATQRHLARSVSLAVFPSAGRDEEVRRRFSQMLDGRARLDHRNLQVVLDFGFKEEVGYFAAEWLEGHSLAHELRESGPMPPIDTLRTGARVFDALDQMHRRGSFHGGIAPANIRLEPDSRPVLTEIALTELTGDTRAEYEPPEGPGANAAADVYAMAIVVIELTLGTNPFLADTDEATRERHRSLDRQRLTLDLKRALGSAAPALVAAVSPAVPERPTAKELAAALRDAADALRAGSGPMLGFLVRTVMGILSSRAACWLLFPTAAASIFLAVRGALQ